jgi:predicted nucleic acid-binding protein
MSRSHITWAEMNTPDGGRLAGYLLERLDQGEQRFAALAIPKDLPDIHLDEVQTRSTARTSARSANGRTCA